MKIKFSIVITLLLNSLCLAQFVAPSMHARVDSLPDFVSEPGYNVIKMDTVTVSGDTIVAMYFTDGVKWFKYLTETDRIIIVDPGEDVCNATAQLVDGGTILFMPGIHKVDTKCVITENNVTFIGYGSSTIFEPTTSIDTLFAFNDADSLEFAGINIHAGGDISVPVKLENSDFFKMHSFFIDSASVNCLRFDGTPGSKNGKVSNAIVRNSSGDNVLISTSDNIEFDQFASLFAGSDGINLVQSDECSFVQCDVSSNLENGFKIESPATPIYGVQIRNSRISSNNNHGILLVNAKFTQITNNIIKSNSQAGAETYDAINVDNSDNTQIVGNTMYDYKDSAFDSTRFGINFNASSDSGFVLGNYFQEGVVTGINDSGTENEYPVNYYGSNAHFTQATDTRFFYNSFNSTDYWQFNSNQLALVIGGTQVADFDTALIRINVEMQLNTNDPTLAQEGGVGWKSDHFSLNHGGIKVNDGTGAVILTGVQEGDAYSGGDVLTIQADGTILWDAPSGGGSSVTVEEADGVPSVSSVSTLQFDQTDGFTVTDEGGNQAQVDLVNAPDAAVANDITIDNTSSGTIDLDRDDPATNEGRIAWNATDNRIWVGEAGGSLEFYSGAHTVDTGENNTASNLGGGLANFDSKSGIDLRFNTFASDDFDLGSNLLSIDDTKWARDAEIITDHGGMTGLLDDDHTNYALLAGRSGGQTLIGGTDASNSLILESTSNATKGTIHAEDQIYFPDELNLFRIEGNTADANETTVDAVEPTTDNTVTIPNASGTFAVSAGSPVQLSVAGDISLNQGSGTDVTGDLEEETHVTEHQNGGVDELNVDDLSGLLTDAQKTSISKNSGAIVGTRQEINFIEGSNITLTIADDAGNSEVDITIDASASGESNTASNLGGGLANFDSKSGVDLRFNTFASADFDLNSNLFSIDDSKWAKDSEIISDHGGLTGLLDDDHTNYALLAGRSGGQSLVGGIGASESLSLESTSNVTKGTIDVQDQMYFPDVTTPFRFEGSTADNNETEITLTNPTADRSINLPNAGGTFAVSANSPVTLSALGDIGLTQDAGTDVTADLEEETHGTEHENGGIDEIDVGGLSGRLSEAQNVSVYKNNSFVGTGFELDFTEGSNTSLIIADAGNQINIAIASTLNDLSGEPFITHTASGNLSNEQVLTEGNYIDVSTATISMDPTEVGSVTWGTADATWTFDVTTGTNAKMGWTNETIVFPEIFASQSTIIRQEAGSDAHDMFLTNDVLLFRGNKASGDFEWEFTNVGTSGNGQVLLTNVDLDASGVSTQFVKAGILNATNEVQINGTQIAASDLSNSTTGSNSIVLETSPNIDTPNLQLRTSSSTEEGNLSWDSSGDFMVGGTGSTTREFRPHHFSVVSQDVSLTNLNSETIIFTSPRTLILRDLRIAYYDDVQEDTDDITVEVGRASGSGTHDPDYFGTIVISGTKTDFSSETITILNSTMPTAYQMTVSLSGVTAFLSGKIVITAEMSQ